MEPFDKHRQPTCAKVAPVIGGPETSADSSTPQLPSIIPEIPTFKDHTGSLKGYLGISEIPTLKDHTRALLNGT